MSSSGLRGTEEAEDALGDPGACASAVHRAGYEATTIDQIAAAAEIYASTFFRYFPSKEDVVIQDPYDEMLLEGLLHAPPELSPIAAIRMTLRRAFAEMGPAEQAKVLERTRLTMAVPALRAKSLENFLNTLAILREGLSARTGRDPKTSRYGWWRVPSSERSCQPWSFGPKWTMAISRSSWTVPRSARIRARALSRGSSRGEARGVPAAALGPVERVVGAPKGFPTGLVRRPHRGADGDRVADQPGRLGSRPVMMDASAGPFTSITTANSSPPMR
jgi:AcrR family transcriptional regulator